MFHELLVISLRSKNSLRGLLEIISLTSRLWFRNVVTAFMLVLLLLALPTKFKRVGHLGLTKALCAQLISQPAGVMNTCSVLR